MNPWEKPGMTVEERARAVMDAPVYGPQTLYDNLTSALRAAVRDAVEAEAQLILKDAADWHTEGVACGATERGIRCGIVRDELRAIAADIRARNGGEG